MELEVSIPYKVLSENLRVGPITFLLCLYANLKLILFPIQLYPLSGIGKISLCYIPF